MKDAFETLEQGKEKDPARKVKERMLHDFQHNLYQRMEAGSFHHDAHPSPIKSKHNAPITTMTQHGQQTPRDTTPSVGSVI